MEEALTAAVPPTEAETPVETEQNSTTAGHAATQAGAEAPVETEQRGPDIPAAETTEAELAATQAEETKTTTAEPAATQAGAEAPVETEQRSPDIPAAETTEAELAATQAETKATTAEPAATQAGTEAPAVTEQRSPDIPMAETTEAELAATQAETKATTAEPAATQAGTEAPAVTEQRSPDIPMAEATANTQPAETKTDETLETELFPVTQSPFMTRLLDIHKQQDSFDIVTLQMEKYRLDYVSELRASSQERIRTMTLWAKSHPELQKYQDQLAAWTLPPVSFAGEGTDSQVVEALADFASWLWHEGHMADDTDELTAALEEEMDKLDAADLFDSDSGVGPSDSEEAGRAYELGLEGMLS